MYLQIMLQSSALQQFQNMPLDEKGLEKAANLLRGIAHPTRLAIVQSLTMMESCSVGELSKSLGVEMSLLSHHLGQMRILGLLKTNRKGKFVYYQIAEPELLKMLECVTICTQKQS